MPDRPSSSRPPRVPDTPVPTSAAPKPRVDLAAVRMVMRRTGGRFRRPPRLRLRDGG